MLTHQLAYEEQVNDVIKELQKEEDAVRRELLRSITEQERTQRGFGRLVAYQAMLEEDEEVREDTLHAMREGKAGARLDSYLSFKCGLTTMSGFAYASARRVSRGVAITYVGRVYHSARVLSEVPENCTWRVKTEEREYLMHLPTKRIRVIITESEVSCI